MRLARLRRALPPLALTVAVVAGTVGTSGCARPTADEQRPFVWRGAVPPDGWLRIRDLNGSVRVARAPGAEVVVTGTPRARGRRPETVRFAAVPEAGGITICALWGPRAHCTGDGYAGDRRLRWISRLFGGRDDVTVDFVVALPAGVRLDASTVNGGITVADAAGEVRAHTVNGPITVDARGGSLDAGTVNGSVRARLGPLAPGATVALATTNGSVDALVPAALDAEVDLSTVNGRVASDLPLADRSGDRRTLRGTLGAGGSRVALRTVNGSVRLQRM